MSSTRNKNTLMNYRAEEKKNNELVIINLI